MVSSRMVSKDILRILVTVLTNTHLHIKFNVLIFRLSWYCYGPPEGTPRTELKEKSMFHLQQVKATPREMMEAELSEHIDVQDKKVRRKHRELSTDNEVDDEIIASKGKAVQENRIQVVKELRMPSATPISLLNECIQSKTAMIVIAQRMGRPAEEIDQLNAEVYELLKKKSDFAYAEFQRVQSL